MKTVSAKIRSVDPRKNSILCASKPYDAPDVSIAGSLRKILFIVIAAAGFSGIAQADDEALENKPSLMWLSNDTSVSVFDDSTYESFLAKSEFWTDNWGVSANLMQNNDNDVFGQPKDSEYFNFDVKRRFGSRDKSNIELGLGWQELNIDSQLDASGPKVSLGGRLNFTSSLQLYGSTSYFPELEDTIQNNTATAYEVEAGVRYQPTPAVSLKAGYRHFSLDLEDPVVEDLGSSSGFLLGSDWSW